MARLPVPHGDAGQWGGILNDFLAVAHNTDGSFKRDSDIDTALSTANAAQTAANTAQTNANGRISSAIGTAKGDLLVASAASTFGRLGVGANGQQLVADSAQALGIRWTTPVGPFLMAADYGVTFDGSTDDSSTLQDAIDDAIATDKPLFLSPGTAIIGTSLTINGPVTIVGSGRESTILKADDALTTYVIVFSGGAPGVGIVGAHLSDFAIDGNSGNVTAGGGIQADGAVQCSFERVHCYSCYDWGLKLGPITGGAFGHHNRVMACLFDNAGGSPGFGGGVWTTSNDENWFYGSDFEFLGGATNPLGTRPVMLLDQAGLQFIVNSNFVGGSNNVIGIRVQNTKGTKIVGCTFDGTAGDSVFIVANKCIIANNLFTSPGDQGSVAASGIHLEFNTHYNTVIGNSLETSNDINKTRSLIREESTGGGGDNIIIGNTMSVNAANTVAVLESAGANTIVRDNIGWVTESNGTATVANGTTTIVVTHGLSITPTLSIISVTPTNNLGNATKYWISTPTATQFTINVDVDPGAGTAAFVWSIRN